MLKKIILSGLIGLIGLIGLNCFADQVPYNKMVNEIVKPNDKRFGNAQNIVTGILQYELYYDGCSSLSMKDEMNLKYQQDNKLSKITQPTKEVGRYEVTLLSTNETRIFYVSLDDCKKDFEAGKIKK